MSFYEYIFFVCLISFAKSEENSELLLVNVIFRHGARTTHKFYPTDPNKNVSFFPIGFGDLTIEGRMGAFKLGVYLKELYGDFLGKYYLEKEVYVQSTNVTRTKMSAQLVLAGLFPPREKQIWNSDLMWQPIPVTYKKEKDEEFLQPLKTCKYRVKVISGLPKLKEVKAKYIQPYEKTYKYIEDHSGKLLKRDPLAMKKFYNILGTENAMNLTLPQWTKEIFPEPAHIAGAQVFAYHNHGLKMKQINAGYTLKKILDDSKAKIDGKSKKKIYLYSVHESNLGYMLNALGVDKTVHIPPWSSAILFELRKGTDGQHYMKLRYKRLEVADDLQIPGCDVLCPLEKFKDLQKDLIPTVSMKAACKTENSTKPTNSTEVRNEATRWHSPTPFLQCINIFEFIFVLYSRIFI